MSAADRPTAAPDDTFSLVRHPGAVDLFRFSAVTWNAHRIHYDHGQAAAEGLPGVVVQSHLHGAYLAQAVLRWGGPRSRIRALSWRNRLPVTASERVTVRGVVTAVRTVSGRLLADCALTELNDRGEPCVTGTATVELAEERSMP
ncbi:acyl dehydratase [Streptomyces sp. NPDC057580]|uniref:acyl dehydratase n=1 Tax=Streptomyces sp. NPDC057580 TaxID=3346173 RepID=UPI0036908826